MATTPHGKLPPVRPAAPARRWIALCVALLATAPAFAAEPPAGGNVNDRALWGFAESLLRQGEYYRAVSEYRRLIHYFPESPHTRQAQLRVGEALLLGGEAGEALRHLDGLLDAAAKQERPGGDADTARFLRGVARLDRDAGRPYPLRQPGIGQALEDFRAVSPAWKGRKYLLGFAEAMEQPPELPEKSPWLAGSMSALLPGAGSFYVGRYAEGSLAFFVSGVLFYATAGAIQRERDGLALVMGALALTFYGGSIYAAANGAHKFNDRQQSGYLTAQRQKFGIVVQRGGLAGVFRKDF